MFTHTRQLPMRRSRSQHVYTHQRLNCGGVGPSMFTHTRQFPPQPSVAPILDFEDACRQVAFVSGFMDPCCKTFEDACEQVASVTGLLQLCCKTLSRIHGSLCIAFEDACDQVASVQPHRLCIHPSRYCAVVRRNISGTGSDEAPHTAPSHGCSAASSIRSTRRNSKHTVCKCVRLSTRRQHCLQILQAQRNGH
jgi:hypothetical protein